MAVADREYMRRGLQAPVENEVAIEGEVDKRMMEMSRELAKAAVRLGDHEVARLAAEAVSRWQKRPPICHPMVVGVPAETRAEAEELLRWSCPTQAANGRWYPVTLMLTHVPWGGLLTLLQHVDSLARRLAGAGLHNDAAKCRAVTALLRRARDEPYGRGWPDHVHPQKWEDPGEYSGGGGI